MTTQNTITSATVAPQAEPNTVTHKYVGVVIEIKPEPTGDVITVCLEKGTTKKPRRAPELFYSYELDPVAAKLHAQGGLMGASVWVQEGLDADEALVMGPLHLTDAEAAFAAAESNEENTMSTNDTNTATLGAAEPAAEQLNGAANHPAEPETAAAVEQPVAETAAPEAQAASNAADAEQAAEGDDEQPKPTEFYEFAGVVTKTQSFRVFVEVDEPTRVDLDVRNAELIFWRDRNSWSEAFVTAYKQMKVWKGLAVKFRAGRDADDHLVLIDLAPAGEFVARAGGEFVYSGPRQGQPRDNRRDQAPKGNQRQGQPRDNRRDQAPKGNQRQGQPQGETKVEKKTRYAGQVFMISLNGLTIKLNERAAEALNKVRLQVPTEAYSAEFATALEAREVVTGRTVVTFAWDGKRASDVKVAKDQAKAAAK